MVNRPEAEDDNGSHEGYEEESQDGEVPEAENDKKAKKATIRKLRRQEVREAAKRKPRW